MAVKIVRQPNKIALIGAPTSAGAHAPGQERAPAVLRAAGLVERLQSVGYQVTDLGDIEPQLFQPDEESPRARNVAPALKALHALRPLVEQAAKSGALPLILGGECSIALATIAGLRRYYRHVGLLYFDRDADLNVPATTPSGRLDGMVVAHITGRGAAELVRFWGEPPLVREPDIVLFGLDRLDPPEREFLEQSPMLRYTAAEISNRGAAASARNAAERLHGSSREFVLHFDTDVIATEDFGACDVPGSGGLGLEEVRSALDVFVQQTHLAAFEVTEFNPERDADGSKAALLVDLLASALSTRLAALAAPAPEHLEEPPKEATQPTEASAPESVGPAPAVTEAPAEALESPTDVVESAADVAESPAEVSPSVSSDPAPDNTTDSDQPLPEQ